MFRAAALFRLFFLGVRVLAMAVAGGAVAVAALALPAALSGDPDHSQRKQHSQYYQRDDPAKCQHIHPSISFVRLSAPKYTRFAGKEQQPAARFLCRAQPVRLPCCNVANPETGMAFLLGKKMFRKKYNNFKLGLAFLQKPCYNNHVPVRSAQHKRIWRISSAG